MKRIEFKKLPKELLAEGITIELLNKVQDSGKFSPAMMQKGDEPVTLIKANNEAFWIQLDDGTFLKDKGRLLTFGIKECIVARARYWTLFSDVETAMGEQRRTEAMQREIQKEVQRITDDVKRTASELISNFKEIKRYASEEGLGMDILKQINPRAFQYRVDEAKAYMEQHPGIKERMDSIEEMLKAEDYDSLYMVLETQGLPLVATIPTDNMELLKRFLHRDKIKQTIEGMKSRGHIENVATFNVLKKYS